MKRVNHIIKSKLLNLSKRDSDNKITINFDTKIEKVIKEKNINNEITKYDIFVTINAELKNLRTQKVTKYATTKNGFYNVEENNSSTRSMKRN